MTTKLEELIKNSKSVKTTTTKPKVIKNDKKELTDKETTELLLYNTKFNINGRLNTFYYKNDSLYQKIPDLLKQYFFQLFKWNGEFDNEFKIQFQKLLFQNGKVAVIKVLDKIYACAFNQNSTKDVDFYLNPTKIKITTNNKYNGMVVNEEDFVIVYNNSTKTPTLHLLYHQLKMIVESKNQVDNNQILNNPKSFINLGLNDKKAEEFVNEITSSNNPFVITSQVITPTNIEFNDLSDTKIKEFNFQLSLFFKLLGSKSGSLVGKNEGLNELEVASDDYFDNKIIEDMFYQMKVGLEEINKKFGTNISLEELEQEEKMESNNDRMDEMTNNRKEH